MLNPTLHGLNVHQQFRIQRPFDQPRVDVVDDTKMDDALQVEPLAFIPNSISPQHVSPSSPTQVFGGAGEESPEEIFRGFAFITHAPDSSRSLA